MSKAHLVLLFCALLLVGVNERTWSSHDFSFDRGYKAEDGTTTAVVISSVKSACACKVAMSGVRAG